MGLADIGNDPTDTPQPGLQAAMLDAESSWHDVIRRNAPPEAAERIVASPFFQAIAARFPAGQAYAAAEQMTAHLEEGRWDLVVVDTPPAGGGIDFFQAPAGIRKLVGGRLLRWLTGARLPARRRLYRLTAGPALRLADAVLGSRLLEEVAEFLLDLRSAYDGVTRRARHVERRLRGATTIVITTADPAPLAETVRFFTALPEVAAPPALVVFNRTLPVTWAHPGEATSSSEALRTNLDRWGSEALRQEHARRELAARYGVAPATIPWLPEAPTGLEDLAGLVEAAAGLDIDRLGLP